MQQLIKQSRRIQTPIADKVPIAYNDDSIFMKTSWISPTMDRVA